MAVCYARHHAPVMEVYDGTVIAHIPIFQEQICEIRTPFLVRLVRMEVLIQFVLEYFMAFRFVPGFLGRTMERRPICVFIYLWMVAAL